MKILVTGGAGFIGSNFIFYMRKKRPDDVLVCLDKLTYAGNLETLAPVMDAPHFQFIRAGIADREAVYGVFIVVCETVFRADGEAGCGEH